MTVLFTRKSIQNSVCFSCEWAIPTPNSKRISVIQYFLMRINQDYRSLPLQREVQLLQREVQLLQREVHFSILFLCSRTLKQVICDCKSKNYKDRKQIFWPLFLTKKSLFLWFIEKNHDYVQFFHKQAILSQKLPHFWLKFPIYPHYS